MLLVGKARGREDALLWARQRPDVILLDLDLDGYCSLDMLPDLLRISGGSVLIHTGIQDRRLHDAAMDRGALGVVGKGDPAEVILRAIECVKDRRVWKNRTSQSDSAGGKPPQ